MALVLLAWIAVVVPVPFSGSGYGHGPKERDGCTFEWEGQTPLPLAAYEAIRNRPPPYMYDGTIANLCKVGASSYVPPSPLLLPGSTSPLS